MILEWFFLILAKIATWLYLFVIAVIPFEDLPPSPDLSMFNTSIKYMNFLFTNEHLTILFTLSLAYLTTRLLLSVFDFILQLAPMINSPFNLHKDKN